MNAKTIFEMEWPYLLTFLPKSVDLEASAREFGALNRRRSVDSASVLLRLALVYGFCGLSLRQTTAWAEIAEVASLSNVALLKRLRSSSAWLGHLLGTKLAERAYSTLPTPQNLRIRIVDATTISRPGSTGTDWRIHLGYNLNNMSIDHIELSDSRGGETLSRFTVSPGEVIVGDRGYAHRRGLSSVVNSGAYFLVRTNWQNLPLQITDGKPFPILDFLRALFDAQSGEITLQTAPDSKKDIPAIHCRFIAIRKTEVAAEKARKKTLKERSKKRRSIDPRTLEAAGYTTIITSVPGTILSCNEVLELYRFRWQIELAFKRLKGLLHLGELPAKDPLLAKSIIYSKLLAALILDDFTERFLAFSPWGFSTTTAPPITLEDSESAN